MGQSTNWEWFGSEEGEVVTCFNGAMRPLSDLHSVARTLATKAFRVLLIDVRPTEADTEETYFFENIAGRVEAIWTKTQVTQTHLVGFSFGGAVALLLAGRQKATIPKLVLVSTAAVFPNWDSKNFAFPEYVSSAFLNLHPLLYRKLEAQYVLALGNSLSRKSALLQRHALSLIDLRPLVPRVSSDTLILHGSQDAIVPLERAHELAEALPHACLKKKEQGSHLLLAESAPWLLNHLISFLRPS